MTTIKTKKSKLASYRHELNAKGRESLKGWLKHDRALLAGKVADYNPYLGDRFSQLRKQTARTVISLVLNRTK